MAQNPNFDILEPTAWERELLANDYPMRPMLARSSAGIVGSNNQIDIAGQVAARNKTVKVPKAVKPEGDAKIYSGTYDKDDPDAEQPEITMEDVLYRSFFVDKWDQKFALPDLIDMHVAPRIQNILDTINKNYMKREADKFAAVFADDNSGATVIDDGDVRFMNRILKERHNVSPQNLAAYVDPGGEADLKGLPIFQEGDKRGDSATQRSSTIMGDYSGFTFFTETNSNELDASGDVGNAVVDAEASAGDTTVSVDDGSDSASNNTLSEGQKIYFTGTQDEDEYYTVDSATTEEIVLKEELRSTVADNAAVNAAPAGDAQYFYQDGSISLVTALPDESRVTNGAGVTRVRFFEPTNRVNFLISLEGDTSGLDITIETLVGAKNFYETRGGIYLRGETDKA